MKWQVYFVLLLCMLSTLRPAQISSLFHSETNSTNHDWVVRFNSAHELTAAHWPNEISPIALFEPVACVAIRTSLSENELRASLLQVKGASNVTRARHDLHGSAVYPTGSALIAFEGAVDSIAIQNLLHCRVERVLRALHWAVVRIPSNQTFTEFKNKCMAIEDVDDVFEDEIIEGEEHQSNDPLYATSWHIAQTSDKDIDADEGWALIPSTAATKSIAMIEGVGFDTLNADLTGRFIDRYNTVDQTNNVYANTTIDKHGTAVIGIPGAMYNNAISAAGLSKNKLMIQAIRIGFNTTSAGTFSTTAALQADAINRAMSLSSTAAISMSFGSTTNQSAFSAAILSATTQGRAAKGIPVFASTGNSGLNAWTNYPAMYSGVIAVGSTTSTDVRSSFSNYGNNLTLSAPGSSIATTDITGANGYSTGDNTFFSGTSAAAPVAATVGALLIVANPTITAAQVKQYLAQSCEKVGGYTYSANATNNLSTWSSELGYGRVNMRAALQLCLPQTTTLPDVTLNTTSLSASAVSVGQTITINATQAINPATASAVSPTLEYRYSTDAVWSSNDIVIGTDVSALGGGIASEIENITYTIPAGTGTFYILMNADALGVVSESNEGNNLVALPITVSAASNLPDITIANAAVSASQVAAGQTITISCNQVRTPLPSITSYATLEYRYSTDALWQNTDTYIGNDISTFTTTIGSEAENISFTIPAGSGARYIIFKCDASNTTVESNENNNVVALPITVQAAVSGAHQMENETPEYFRSAVVYPNPATDIIHVKFGSVKPHSVSIYNAKGELRMHENTRSGRAFESYSIAELEVGIYTLIIESAGATGTHRFIKE